MRLALGLWDLADDALGAMAAYLKAHLSAPFRDLEGEALRVAALRRALWEGGGDVGAQGTA